MLLMPFESDYSVPLRRAPDVRQACIEALRPGGRERSVTSLRELLGLIGAHEWRKKGIEIPALGGRIHPHYGVFAPVRSEYVDLVATAPLPADERWPSTSAPAPACSPPCWRAAASSASSPPTGPARAGVRPREHRAARARPTGGSRARPTSFPQGRAPLVVCNPPWIPARPSSPLEHAIYDPDSRMLRGFLGGLAAHLEPGGEGWLVLSDIAEHLGLRSRAELLARFRRGGTEVADRTDVRPHHPKASDADDPLHAARAAEVTSLWRLKINPSSSTPSSL